MQLRNRISFNLLSRDGVVTLHLQGESGMRQVSEKRSSLRFPLKFSEFHQKSSATVSSWSELKPKPTPSLVPSKPKVVSYFYFVHCKSGFETFHLN